MSKVIDFLTKCEIERNVERIKKIINSGIFEPKIPRNIFFESAFIEILICMRDLMFKTQKYVSRISFTEDVITIPNEINDVTDLIKFVRDSLCHPESTNHYLDLEKKIKATFNVGYGKCNVMNIGDIVLTSDYEDDICFFFGKQKIYLKRHIIRALEESTQKLLPLF